jgi:hypothetical protein
MPGLPPMPCVNTNGGHGTITGDPARVILLNNRRDRVPRFVAVARDETGAVHLDLETRTAADVVLQASIDLGEWLDVATLSVGPGPTRYTDRSSAGHERRFYRTRQAP